MAKQCENNESVLVFIEEYKKKSEYKEARIEFQEKVCEIQNRIEKKEEEFQFWVSEIFVIQGILILHSISGECLLIANNERSCRDLLLSLPDNISVTCFFNDERYGNIVREFIGTAEDTRYFAEGYKNSGFISQGRRVAKQVPIVSKKDTRVQEYKNYNTLSGRLQNHKFVAEGTLLVKRALSDGQLVEMVCYVDNNTNLNHEEIKEIIRICKEKGIVPHPITPGIMSAITNTHPLPNVIAVVKMAVYNEKDLILSKGQNSFLILDGVSNPDNLGIILRTADACGISGIILLSNSTHFMNKNAIRGGRGAIGRLPIYVAENDKEVFDILKAHDFKIIATSARSEAGMLYTKDYFEGNFAVVIGNESNGIRDDIIQLCTDFIKIPMAGGQSSLNVAVAAGTILYEYVRTQFYNNP